MKILSDFNLKNHNTFGVSHKAKFFVEISSKNEIKELFKRKEFAQNEKLILGGGSNILLTKDFDGIVIKNNILGREILFEDKNNVIIEVFSGENWHELVLWSLENNFFGLENLSLIPGNVGSCPIQNIGAYGVEVADFIEKVNFVKIDENKEYSLKNKECNFGYRDSIFKNDLKSNFIITSVVFKLNKNFVPNIKYGIIQDTLDKSNSKTTAKNISKSIIQIRNSKLPDPKIIGNAGSFFKNPIVSKSFFDDLKLSLPDLKGFEIGNSDTIKIPAGWLIEEFGWKGKKIGSVGVYDKQSLVLVNYSSDSGKEIWNLSQQIIDDIYQKTKIKLQREVNIF